MKKQPTPEQKEKAKARREALRGLWANVAKLDEKERADFVEKLGALVTTCEGHNLTACNSILLSYQRDNVTVVGGYNQWRANGRQVRKGETSLGIWIPCGSGQKDESDDGDVFFIFGSVFDISQTDPIQP